MGMDSVAGGEDDEMNRIEKAIYESVALLKHYCPNCKINAFVINGILQCCGLALKNIPEHEKEKRYSETEKKRSYIPIKIKQEILAYQENKCIYCEHKFNDIIWHPRRKKYIHLRIHFDHFVCWNYSGNNRPYNLVASCHVCNQIKHDKYFPDIPSAREFILKRRHEKGFE